MVANTPECTMTTGKEKLPDICTMVLSFEYPHDSYALYGADGKFLDEGSGYDTLLINAHTEHDCELVKFATVWDGAITQCVRYGFDTTEYETVWPKELGDWLYTPIPAEFLEEPEEAA